MAQGHHSKFASFNINNRVEVVYYLKVLFQILPGDLNTFLTSWTQDKKYKCNTSPQEFKRILKVYVDVSEDSFIGKQ